MYVCGYVLRVHGGESMGAVVVMDRIIFLVRGQEG